MKRSSIERRQDSTRNTHQFNVKTKLPAGALTRRSTHIHDRKRHETKRKARARHQTSHIMKQARCTVTMQCWKGAVRVVWYRTEQDEPQPQAMQRQRHDTNRLRAARAYRRTRLDFRHADGRLRLRQLRQLAADRKWRFACDRFRVSLKPCPVR